MIVKPIFQIAILLVLVSMISFDVGKSEAQTLIVKKDTITYGSDSIAILAPTGSVEKAAFTVRSTVIGDTLYPQARYGSSTEWVTTSVKNIRTQTSDTIIRISPTSYPIDYEINDPAIYQFRLVSNGARAMTTRKVYVNYRYRRRE